jgi:hypothetical protein
VTLSPVCFQGTFYGVKAVIYNSHSRMETGVF